MLIFMLMQSFHQFQIQPRCQFKHNSIRSKYHVDIHAIVSHKLNTLIVAWQIWLSLALTNLNTSEHKHNSSYYSYKSIRTFDFNYKNTTISSISQLQATIRSHRSQPTISSISHTSNNNRSHRSLTQATAIDLIDLSYKQQSISSTIPSFYNINLIIIQYNNDLLPIYSILTTIDYVSISRWGEGNNNINNKKQIRIK